MKLSAEEFRELENKSITLLGMSGVGKTFLSNILRKSNWFHYSGDYRIGTRYLNEPILDNIKIQAMQVPFLRDLLRSDAIFINNNITIDQLDAVSSFIGKLGDPELGGMSLEEFKRRQDLFRKAEIAAMLDVPEFIDKAHKIYGFNNFINDAGGSLCELDNNDLFEILAEHTLFVYIQANEEDEKRLIARSKSAPKPLYYRSDFLDEQLAIYMQEQNLEYVAMINPDSFVRWIFPRLFYSRIPSYEAIAEKYGYTIKTEDLYQIKTEADFLKLVENAITAKED
ncbi:MAG TPA: ATPase [Leucothrix sp.]|nr:ATPase [Leucothrix sp.]